MNRPHACARFIASVASTIPSVIPAAVILSASLGGLGAAHADCWESFSPDRLTTTKVRLMDRKMARDLLVFLHGQGEIVLNDVSGKEMNDTKEGLPAYKNKGHNQFFDAACNVKWPAPNDKVYLNQTIAGIPFRYWASGDKKRPADRPVGSPLNNLDTRHAVGLVWFTRSLKEKFPTLSQIYHVGVGNGQGPKTDQHNDGRAFDFVGAQIGSERFTELNDWQEQKPQPDNQRDYPRLPYRLQGTGKTPEALFRTVYDFATQHYCDKADRITTLGENSQILHPDSPKASERTGHLAHLHIDIPVTPNPYCH